MKKPIKQPTNQATNRGVVALQRGGFVSQRAAPFGVHQCVQRRQRALQLTKNITRELQHILLLRGVDRLAVVTVEIFAEDCCVVALAQTCSAHKQTDREAGDAMSWEMGSGDEK